MDKNWILLIIPIYAKVSNYSMSISLILKGSVPLFLYVG
ncbi:Low molecular weight protein tyrosine phosphatase (EC 3.1.3.48) [uncultured Gammaproteobacteria bacterium]|nr:Low molecular weight protein tyrosine phosphatase (EC 3.1.3.48) [uncultured Gammaproteobacteria bacterium]